MPLNQIYPFKALNAMIPVILPLAEAILLLSLKDVHLLYCTVKNLPLSEMPFPFE
jgi:hypothetical protein